VTRSQRHPDDDLPCALIAFPPRSHHTRLRAPTSTSRHAAAEVLLRTLRSNPRAVLLISQWRDGLRFACQPSEAKVRNPADSCQGPAVMALLRSSRSHVTVVNEPRDADTLDCIVESVTGDAAADRERPRSANQGSARALRNVGPSGFRVISACDPVESKRSFVYDIGGSSIVNLSRLCHGCHGAHRLLLS
jgi:hypothetical protein